MTNTYIFKSVIWIYEGDSPWHFVTINKTISKKIRSNLLIRPKGFGSIPVSVKVGKTVWKTSIFPNKNKTYLLPIKKDIRQIENLILSKTYQFSVTTLI